MRIEVNLKINHSLVKVFGKIPGVFKLRLRKT